MFKVCPNLKKSWATRLLAGPLRPTSRNCSSHLQRLGSTQGRSMCLQFVPVQISPANTRPACHFSTTSHPNSSVRHSANQGPTTFISLNQCARHCHQVAHAKQWELIVAVLMMKMINHASQEVNDVCDVETAGGTSSVVCSANLTFFHVRFCIRDWT